MANEKFELNNDEQKIYDVFKEKVKGIHGKYGLFTFKFTGYGMGTGISVFSHLEHKEIDLNDGTEF